MFAGWFAAIAATPARRIGVGLLTAALFAGVAAGGANAQADFPTKAIRLIVPFAPERLVWASDCPFVGEEANVTYQQTIDWLTDCAPDPAVRRKIVCDTPLRRYFS
jgi:predicted TIM-barrel fold metal-dependent hydrolase